MRIASILLLAACMHLSAASLSQTVTLHLKKEPLSKVFALLEKQTGYFVVYNDDLLSTSEPVTIEADRIPLEGFLKKILAGQSLSYSMDGMTILITKNVSKNEKEAISKEFSFALQQRTITGKVMDDKGNALAGVNVRVKNVSSGTVSNAQGIYTIKISNTSTILVFSYVGFNMVEKQVGDNNNLNVTLIQQEDKLNEVVVVGYGTQKKVNLTGAVATVKGDVLARAPMASTVNTLAGRLPGLVVKQTTGQPGFDQSRINIRNFGTALVIVDGVEQSFNNIDASEIESVSILKDASAAIYGARAGNGVILITTKRGSIGKTKISLNSTYSGQSYTNFGVPVNAGQYATLYREAQLNAGIPEQQVKYSEEDVAKYFAGTDPQYPNTNWMDEIMKKIAPQQLYNVAVEGGNEKVKYYTFLGYLNQGGMFKGNNTGYERYNLRSNLDVTVSQQFSLSLDITGIFENGKQSSRPASEEWFWMDFLDSQPTAPASYPDPSKIPHISPGPYNAIINTHEDLGGYNKNYNNPFNAALTLAYKIKSIPGLDLKAKVNYNQVTNDQKIWRKQAQVWNYDYATDTYSLFGVSEPTQLQQEFSKNQAITGQLSANFNRTFNEKHSVSGLVLFEAIDYAGKDFSALRQHYITTAIDQLFAGGTLDQMANGSATQSGRESIVGRLNYGYNNKYLLEATVRYDGSPNFPKDGRWGLFPSISAGWRISEEPFIKNKISWLDEWKLRGGISQTGYDGVPAYQYLAGYQFSGTYVLDGKEVSALKSTGLSNPNITWETMTLSNIGMEISVLKGKVFMEADLFQRFRDNMLGSRVASLPNTFGASLPDENINSQWTRGGELVLGSKGAIGGLKYSVSGNISYSRSKWAHFDEVTYTDPDEKRIYQKTGQWTDVGYGYKSDGLFTSQSEIDALNYDMDGQANKTLNAGDIKILDLNNDGKIDWRDYTKINNGGTPHIMYGLNLDLQYKQFDFSMLAQGAADYSVSLESGNINMDSERTPTKVVWNERWTPENNDRNAIIPRQKIGQTTNNWNSDFWNRNASFVRLKNITLGYTAKSNFFNRAGIDNLRIFITCVNLFTINPLSKYGLDPESPDATRGWTYPIQKTYSLGLNLTF